MTVDSNISTANEKGPLNLEDCQFTDLTPRPRINVPHDMATIEEAPALVFVNLIVFWRGHHPGSISRAANGTIRSEWSLGWQALKMIPHNGVVAVHPGSYRPNCTMYVRDKTVDIEGVGEVGSVTIEQAEFQIRGAGVIMRLLNLILADSNDNAVQVMGGAEALVEDCEIFGSRSNGIEVTDVGSKAPHPPLRPPSSSPHAPSLFAPRLWCSSPPSIARSAMG
jgi:hypothetical protein